MRPTDPFHARHWSTPDDEGLSLWELWEIAWAGRWWIAACALVAGLIGASWAFLQPARYQCQVVLMPVEHAPAATAAAQATETSAATARGLFASPGIPLLTLQSARFAESFIEKHELLPILFAELWDTANQRWDVESGDEVPDLRDAVECFRSEVLTVEADPRSGVTRVCVSWSDPLLARAWADALVRELNETLRAQALTEAERNVEHLKSEMPRSGAATVQHSIARLLEIELERVMLAKVHSDVGFTVVDPARTPKEPFEPRRLRLTLMGLAAGAALGAMAVFLRRSFRARRVQLAALAAAQAEAEADGALAPRTQAPIPALWPASRGGLTSIR